MKTFVTSLCSGIAAGLISGAVILALAGPPIDYLGWSVIVAVAAATLGISWVAQKRHRSRASVGGEVLTDLVGGRDVSLSDVTVETDNPTDVRVASKLRAGKDVNVSRLRVGPHDDSAHDKK
jgi:hypothetical protein